MLFNLTSGAFQMNLTKHNYAQVISNLSQYEKVSFYEFLAHDLTISSRAMWSDKELSKDEVIESMKWLNEILHRVTTKIRAERLNSHEWKEEDFIEMITHYANLGPISLSSHIAWAINTSYEALGKK
jgi:hypothetical protein